jgi:hypothetical protein
VGLNCTGSKIIVLRDGQVSAQAFTVQTCRKPGNVLYAEGGSGLFEPSDLQRLWRGTHPAARHVRTWDWRSAAWTKAVLGLPIRRVSLSAAHRRAAR